MPWKSLDLVSGLLFRALFLGLEPQLMHCHCCCCCCYCFRCHYHGRDHCHCSNRRSMTSLALSISLVHSLLFTAHPPTTDKMYAKIHTALLWTVYLFAHRYYTRKQKSLFRWLLSPFGKSNKCQINMKRTEEKREEKYRLVVQKRKTAAIHCVTK